MKPKSSPDSLPEIIDISPRRAFHWKRWLIGAVILLLIISARSLKIYLSAVWFDSLGFSSVYWYILELKFALFAIFSILTFAIIRLALWLLERNAGPSLRARRSIIVNE